MTADHPSSTVETADDRAAGPVPDRQEETTAGALISLLSACPSSAPSDSESETPSGFARATRILTERGEAAVEDLKVGDGVMTAAGHRRAVHRIIHRHVTDGTAEAAPILFRTGSLGDRLPARDLVVAPTQAVFIDGRLVPAALLLAGDSIIRLQDIGKIEYFQLQLETPDLLIAERVATESYPDPRHPSGSFAGFIRLDKGTELEILRLRLLQRTLTPEAASSLRGYIDHADRQTVRGWAYDGTDRPVLLTVLDGETVLGSLVADEPRRDLARAALGSNSHGFTFTFPAALDDAEPHAIRVLRLSDGAELQKSPWRLAPVTLPPASPSSVVANVGQGYLDTVRRERIAGWACDPAHREPVSVHLLVNGRQVATVIANGPRQDLGKLNLGSVRFGFEHVFPNPLSSFQRHVIRVIRAHDGVELNGSPAILERADSFDRHLESCVAGALNAIDSSENRNRALTFLLRQAELLRQAKGQVEGQAESGGPLAEGRPRRALLIDGRWPDSSRDAGSVAVLSHIDALRSLGFSVGLCAAYENIPPPLRLTEAGIACHGAPFYESPEAVLRLQEDSYDLVYLHRVDVALQYLALARRYQPHARLVFSVADLQHLRLERQASSEGRPELADRAARLKVQECFVAQQADVTLTHSPQEEGLLQRLLPSLSVACVPWAIPCREKAPSLKDRRDIAFVGHYAHAPNQAAALLLVREIMPLIWKSRPDMKCVLAGSDMPEHIRELAGPQVEIRGHVPDLADIFSDVRLSIAPLTFGAGIKGKVLSSFGQGVPCVMSPVAAEGLELPGELQRLVAPDNEGMADLVLALHDDSRLCATLGRLALAYVLRHNSRDTVRTALSLAISGRTRNVPPSQKRHRPTGLNFLSSLPI